MACGLPSELVREIVSRFSKANDMGTLQAASLVSSAFRKPCQEEIFSKVKVCKQRSFKNDTAHHLVGLEILRRSTTLLSYIKMVSVQQSQYGFISLDIEPMESSMAELIRLIATSSIQEFSFIGWDGQTTPEFQHGIIALVRSPHLTSLSLTYAPTRLVNMVESPHLQHLILILADYCQPSRPEYQLFRVPLPPSPAPHRKRLTSLVVTPEESTINLLLGNSACIELNGVHEITIEYPRQSPGNTLLLIERCTPSLRRLRIATNAITCDLPSHLSHLQQLEELVFDEAVVLNWQDLNPYSIVPSFLDAFPSPNSLSYVELQNFYEGEYHFSGSAEFWARLDSMLADRRRFPVFHTMKFRHTVVDPPKPTPEEWEETQRGYWPALRGVGVGVEMSRDIVFALPRDNWDL
ncbi:hypothetical protein BKA70DRAFT_1283541 [Coprinopsis sp. MPI-PUGE-AT-0042]|nr:hypothetical protein BKA70DRAFT_1283541 [Coprinopsis sp. MPI-PUGE-AT-0042]